MTWIFSVLLKKFILFGYALFVAGCHGMVARFVPDGKIKRALLRRY